MTSISSAPSNFAPVGRHGGAAGGSAVTVQHGDTLSAIAQRSGVPLQTLIAANPQLINPNRIYPGDTIAVPGGMSAGSAHAASASAPSPGGAGTQPASMGLSNSGLNLVKSHEGLRTTAYRDPVGVWTIGYGHTASVKPGQNISEAQAEQLLRKDVGWAEDAVRAKVKVPLTQGQFDALVSFTFNLGAGALGRSTLLKKLNAGDYAGAQAEFGKFVHAGGRVLPGLVRRRGDEAQLFGNRAPNGSTPANGGASSNGATAATPTPSRADSNANAASTPARAGTHTVQRGDTLWNIARAQGVSLQALIAANPQITDRNLIHPGQKIHIPGGGGAEPARQTGTGSVTGAGSPTPAGNASGAATVQIAERFLNRNASELKKSGDLPMNPNVPSNVCCANFVSAVLERNGLLRKGEHTDSVSQLNTTLRNKGWKPVDLANAKPGDVVIMKRGGVSHTEIVAKNENGKVTLIGSNNRNADGSQRITYDSGSWWHSKVSAVLRAP